MKIALTTQHAAVCDHVMFPRDPEQDRVLVRLGARSGSAPPNQKIGKAESGQQNARDVKREGSNHP
jgi:hypothetical protein